MHLSYRGVAYQNCTDSFPKSSRGLRVSSVYRLRQAWGRAAHIVSDTFLSLWGSVQLPAEPALLASPHQYCGLAPMPMSDMNSSIGQSPELSGEQLYSMERALQLAYAVGDRSQIRSLEAEIEAVTGWRFKRERIWLAK